MTNKDKSNPVLENIHWADNSAQRVLDVFPKEEIYTVASGITPSGIVHIGNFREVITTELVRRALEDKGKKTKFIYSWDVYDAFRKVPKNVPVEWEKYLRMSDAAVPDPWGCHNSYATHFSEPMEKEVLELGFPVEFQYQDKLFTSGIYADEIKFAFENKKDIIKNINKHKNKNHLEDTWNPGYVYCSKCQKDTTKIIKYFGGYELEYSCECGNKEKINFKETPFVGLFWRIDWPMRWNFYKVTFEPGGKDHSTPGGSYDTGCDIIKELYNREPPVYTAYNFVAMKGQNGKISSSSGNGVTVGDVLKVYTPELVLFLFAGTRPNAEFDISFDLDVIKIYEDFDKLERIYYGLEEEKNEKKLINLKRIYELSMIGKHTKDREPQKEIPIQPSFRHLTTIAQANNFDFKKVKENFKDEIKTEYDEKRVQQRFNCVKNWLEMHAPEDMKFSINKILSKEFISTLNKKDIEVINEVKKVLENTNSADDLFNEFKRILSEKEMDTKEFFKLMYNLIISKEKGPKLANFMIDNKKSVLDLLKQI